MSFEPLKELRDAEIRLLTQGLNARFEDRGSNNPWPIPIDFRLSSERSLTDAALSERAAALSIRWADTYAAEMRDRLGKLFIARSRYNDVRSRLAEISLAQHEREKLEAIHRREVAAGWYEVDASIAADEAKGQQKWTDNLLSFWNFVLEQSESKLYKDYVQQTPEEAASAGANLALASSISPYVSTHLSAAPASADRLNDQDFLKTRPFSEPGFPDVGKFQGTNILRQIHHHSRMRAAADFFNVRISMYRAQLEAAGGWACSLEALSAKNRAAEWRLKEIEFRRSRTELSFEMSALWRASVDDPDGPNRFSDELRSLRKHFVSELAELLARGKLAAQALQQFWEVSLQRELPLPSTWSDERGSFLEELADWVSLLDNAVGHLAPRDLAATWSISVRNAVGEDAWKRETKRAEVENDGHLRFVFRFDESSPSKPLLARLRVKALAATVVAKQGHEVWCARVRPPKNGKLIGKTGREEFVSQDAFWCDLGRVRSRLSSLPPDIVGGTALRNTAPLSVAEHDTWELQFGRYPSGATDAPKLDDILLDFFLSGLT